MAQTPDGFLWIATENGLARYDGAQFTTLDHSSMPALPANDLCCLVVAGDGTLWVGSSDGLLAMHAGHALALPDRKPFHGDAIARLLRQQDGSIRVVTGGGLQYTVQGSEARAVDAPGGAIPKVLPVEQDEGIEAGDWTADLRSVNWQKDGSAAAWTVGRELPQGRVQSVFVDRQDVAWVAMSTGLVTVDPALRRVQVVAAFQGRSVLSVFEDREGDLWVGTETAGLHELTRNSFRALEGTSDLAVTALAAMSTGVALGTRDAGLMEWRDGHAAPVRSAALQGDDTILCLDRAADGTLWAGTPRGLVRIDPHGVTREWTSTDGLPDDSVRSVAAISADSAWVGTAHGLALVAGAGVRVFGVQQGLAGNLVGALLAARGAAQSDGVWAATEGGLALVTPQGVERTYATAQGLTTPVVAAMAYDVSGRLWLATEDGRLWRMESGRLRRVLQLAAERGHPRAVSALSVAGGRIWIQTSDSVLSASQSRLLACPEGGCGDVARLLTSYRAEQGLTSAETVSAASGAPLLRADGELLFPTRGGVVATMTRDAPGDAPIPVVIERVLEDDRELPDAAQITLPFGRTRLMVEFAGLSLREPRSVRYRYRLEGFDNAWIDGDSRRFATFTALPPGNYVFHVEAALEGQPWGGQEATLGLRITPPFYRRWWFLLLMILAAAATLAAGYRYRLRLLRRRFSAVLAERNRLAREVHDTLAQDLVSTTVQLDLVMMQLGNGRVERALIQLRGLRKFVGDGLAEARQSIADLRDGAVSLDLPARLRAIVARREAIAARTSVVVEGRLHPLQPGVEREVARIVGEALTNAARHAHAREIVVTLNYRSQQLEVSIRDNGVGFALDTQAKEDGHFGVRGMRERAETLGAELVLESTPGAGTLVRLIVRTGESV